MTNHNQTPKTNQKPVVEVLGSGCPICQRMFVRTSRIVKDLNLDCSVEYNSDVTRLVELGVMTSPVLVINNEVVLIGSPGNDERIKEVILEKLKNIS